MEHLVKLIIGDWSGDGHCITESIVVKSNLPSSEIYSAYSAGCKLVGFDLTKDCCNGYQESFLEGEHIKKLRDSGIDISFCNRDEDPLVDEVHGVDLMSEDFADVYLAVCKLANSTFQYKEIRLNEIDIGGYGLCSQ